MAGGAGRPGRLCGWVQTCGSCSSRAAPGAGRGVLRHRGPGTPDRRDGPARRLGGYSRWRYTPRATHDHAMTTSVRFDRLETGRLIMRRWQESDRAPFAELNADPGTMRFFPNTLDRAASNALIEMIETRFDRQGFGFWALEVAATGTFIGFTGLNPLPDGIPGAGGMEVGWRLAKARLASRIRHRGGPGCARRRLRRHGPARDLVHDRGPQRTVTGRHAPAGADGDDPVRPPPDPAGRSAPAAGGLSRHPPPAASKLP